MDAVKIGRTIAFLRKKSGMTQKDLADKINVTDKAVSRWERGMGAPDISFLTKLASILDTDVEAILEGNFTHEEADCKGLLVLNYPEGITSDTYLYTKRIIYYQLSFFLLAGIREICIRGNDSDIIFIKSKLADGESLGIHIFYETVDEKLDMDFMKSDFFSCNNKKCSVLIIDSLYFLYGKDITSSLKRIMFDSVACTDAVTYKKEPMHFRFIPPLGIDEIFREGCIHKELFVFGRGIVSFPIKNEKDLFEAGTIIRIIEEKQNETLYNLQEIARNRGFI